MATNAEETDVNGADAERTADIAEFDAAFDEIDDAPPAGDGPQDVDADDDEPFPDADQDDGEDDKPAAAAKDTDQDDDSDGQDPKDPWSTVPESLRSEREKLINENRAMKGRVPGLQRELEEARRKLAELEAKQTSRTGDPDLDGEVDNDQYARFQEEYPEIAGPMERRLAEYERVINDLKAKVDTHDQSFTQSQVRAQAEALASDEAVGELYEAVKEGGPRNAEFVEWYQTQPREVQAMVEKNGQRIVDADVARTTLTLFAAQTNSLPASRNKGGDDTPNPRDRRNQALLKSAAGVRGKSPGVGRSIPDKDSFDATWDHIEAQEKRRQA